MQCSALWGCLFGVEERRTASVAEETTTSRITLDGAEKRGIE
jgi:hypothetical protein